MYVRAAFLPSLGSDITPPPLESGVRDEIRHQGEQLHVEVLLHDAQCASVVQLQRIGVVVVSSTVARGRNLIPAHEAGRLSQPTYRLSRGGNVGEGLMCSYIRIMIINSNYWNTLSCSTSRICICPDQRSVFLTSSGEPTHIYPD